MKCVQECQTFLWGGAGSPRVDDSGDCLCVCEDEWSAYNILGVPSCVPSEAHVVFGAVGVLTAVAALCQATHQLNRQLKYHAWYLAISVSPAEKCRRQLHVVVIIHAVLSLCYFTMVLALESHQLWGSVVLMSGLTQFTTNIGGMLTLQMWIYTNDIRLMRETPEILAMLNVLEGRVGQHATRCVVCIGAVAGTILAVGRRQQAATKVACVAFVCMCIVVVLAVFRCGTSLMRTINRSSAMHCGSAVDVTDAASESGRAGERQHRLGSDICLVEAKRKVIAATSFCVALGAATIVTLTFSTSSPLGLSAPLLFFAVPMDLSPLVWFGVNIQLHAGRSKRRTTQRFISNGASKTSGWIGKKGVGRAGRTTSPSRSRPVVPTEAAPTSP